MTVWNDDSVALAESLVGRTITRARFFDSSPGQEWAHHEECWLWLDDGRVIQFSSYGYDADGATIDEIHVMDVAACLHCGQAHPDTMVFDTDHTGRVTPYAYCTDGNHIGWRAPAPVEETPGE